MLMTVGSVNLLPAIEFMMSSKFSPRSSITMRLKSPSRPYQYSFGNPTIEVAFKQENYEIPLLLKSFRMRASFTI